MVASVVGHQRILVISTAAGEAELLRLRAGPDPLVLTAPTADARRVVRVLAVEPRVELLLAPVSFPHVDRSHRLDELVRAHALGDRFRDVVVVTDASTATLLLRSLAPDQLPTGGAVTVVGLPRGDRPVAVRRGLASGVGLAIVSAAAEPLVSILALPGIVVLAGLALLLVQRLRHLGKELVLAASVSAAVVLLVVASSARFPGSF